MCGSWLSLVNLTLSLIISDFFLPAQEMSEEPILFRNERGETVQAFQGVLSVPENRLHTQSRIIKLTYVRFPAVTLNKGYPIVYLAGDLGASNIQAARGDAFPLFMELRKISDVIALDMRGTGQSNPIPFCRSQGDLPDTWALTVENMLHMMMKDAEGCTRFWADQGVDISGYNAAEKVHDLEYLRQKLQVEKLNLWGVGYGSQLALNTMRYMEDRIERAVLSSSEGRDHAMKLPIWSAGFFNRVQQAINRDPISRKKYPNLEALMRRVHAKLKKKPVRLSFAAKHSQKPVELILGQEGLQFLTTTFLIRNPENLRHLPAIYADFEKGKFGLIRNLLDRCLFAQPGHTSNLPGALDFAMPISATRFARIEQESESALLGGTLNFPFPMLFHAYGSHDLGESFRTSLLVRVPTLFFSGTLDGRTFPEETWGIMQDFEHSYQVVVEHAGHDLWMSHPQVGETIARFFKDGALKKTHISAEPPQFR